MAKELLIGALRGERVEQTPWLPHIGTHPAQLLGVSAERYLQDAELLARGAVLGAERLCRSWSTRDSNSRRMAAAVAARPAFVPVCNTTLALVRLAEPSYVRSRSVSARSPRACRQVGPQVRQGVFDSSEYQPTAREAHHERQSRHRFWG